MVLNAMSTFFTCIMLARSMAWCWLLLGSLNVGKGCDEFSVLSVSARHLCPLLCCVFIVEEKSAVSLPVWFRVKVFQWQVDKITVRHLRWFAVVLEGGAVSPRTTHLGQATEIVGSRCPWLWDTLRESPALVLQAAGSGGSSDFLKADFPALLLTHVLLWIKSLPTWNM